jgi:hypothetical protein
VMMMMTLSIFMFFHALWLFRGRGPGCPKEMA